MGKSCPANPDTVLREIVSTSKRALAVWGVVSFLIVVAIVFIGYSLVQEVVHWHTLDRARTIRLKGRNNVNDANDDDYAPHPVAGYTVPSGRSIRARLAKPEFASGRDLLDRAKDDYGPEKRAKRRGSCAPEPGAKGPVDSCEDEDADDYDA